MTAPSIYPDNGEVRVIRECPTCAGTGTHYWAERDEMRDAGGQCAQEFSERCPTCGGHKMIDYTDHDHLWRAIHGPASEDLPEAVVILDAIATGRRTGDTAEARRLGTEAARAWRAVRPELAIEERKELA